MDNVFGVIMALCALGLLGMSFLGKEKMDNKKQGKAVPRQVVVLLRLLAVLMALAVFGALKEYGFF